MSPRGAILMVTLVMGLCGIPKVAAAQRGEVTSQLPSTSCRSANSTGAITVRAPQLGASSLSLCDGRGLGGNLAQMSQAQPLALASGDFDEDGTPDLISGFATGKTGQITVHRGNVHALWPYGPYRNNPPAPFFPNARVLAVPEAPDFLVTGDFDADGHLDVVIAKRGGNALYLLRGDARGGFAAPKRISLGGSITALIAGEINRADGLADLVVAINTTAGAKALVFESPTGALNGHAEIFKLPNPATSLALGKLDGEAMNDLAIAAGSDIVVIHARDRQLSLSEEQRKTVAPARVTVQPLSFTVKALTAGDFTGAAPSIAALDEGGTVHILEHAVAENSLLARMSTNPEPTMQLSKPGPDGKPVRISGTSTPATAARIAALRESLSAGSDASEWTERSTVALPGGFSQSAPRLVAARVSGSVQEDLVVVDSGNRQVHVLSTASKSRANRASAMGAIATPTHAPMKLLASLDAQIAPVAVLPMRLNQHGLNGLVILHEGQAEPTVMPQDAPPANIFTVTNTSDSIITVGIVKTGPPGSLRKAMQDANAATGTSSIVFNIPTTDPGYHSQTGTFLIQPLSESVPGALDDFALPPVNATVTIDGYTQPGASPNTLANGDNAKILIQIDGSKATTPGGGRVGAFR